MEHRECVELPKIDPKNFMDEIHLEGMDQLIIYGAGQGEMVEPLLKWLKKKKDRLLIFIEDDLGVLKTLLGSDIGSKILKNPKIQLHFYEKKKDNENLFQRLMWQGWEKNFLLVKDPRYEKDSFNYFKDALLFDKDQMKWFGHEFKNLGVGFFLNFYANLKHLPESYDGAALFDQAEKIPAFIAGAGPSFNKNGHLLRELKRKGYLFAGSSSIPIMKEKAIKPDFGAGIDPNIWQCERIEQYGSLDFPFFYRLRFNHDALEKVDSKKLFVPGSGIYRTPAWIQERLGLSNSEMEEGSNIIHFMTKIAINMGCNPIIYVGLDLAFTNGEMYAKGMGWPIKMPKDSTEGIDIYGQPIMTRWMWLKESFWLANLAKDHPEINFINATEGGLGISEVPNEKLETVLNGLKENVTKEFDFRKLQVTFPQIEGCIKELKESLERVDQLMDEMLEFYRSVDVKKTISLNYPEEAVWSLQLSEEPAFHSILNVFDDFLLQYLSNSHLLYLIQRDGLSPKLAKEIVKAQIQRLDFLKHAIRIQHEMIDKYFKS